MTTRRVAVTETWELSGGGTLYNVHDTATCVAPCPLHAPTDHYAATWPLVWRRDRGIFERICRHGVGHPDPDGRLDGTHGCCGCCHP